MDWKTALFSVDLAFLFRRHVSVANLMLLSYKHLFFSPVMSMNCRHFLGSLREGWYCCQWWADRKIFRSRSDPTQKHFDLDPVLLRRLTAKDPKKSRFGIELEVFTAPARINIVKVLNKDPKIIRLVEKTRIQIHYGSGQKPTKILLLLRLLNRNLLIIDCCTSAYQISAWYSEIAFKRN